MSLEGSVKYSISWYFPLPGRGKSPDPTNPERHGRVSIPLTRSGTLTDR